MTFVNSVIAVHKLTEKELEAEFDRLNALIAKKGATLTDANRFAEVSVALERIRSVRSGKFWP